MSEELDPSSADPPLPSDSITPEMLAAFEADGSQRLWIAVLEQALRDFYGDIPSEGPAHYRQAMLAQCRRSAKAWFLSESNAMGSFRWIAELFDLDARAVRRRLFRGPRIGSVDPFDTFEDTQVGVSALAGVDEEAPRAEVMAAA
jgi:hypothetical protein